MRGVEGKIEAIQDARETKSLSSVYVSDYSAPLLSFRGMYAI